METEQTWFYYKKLGANIYGLDTSEELLKIAEKKLSEVKLKVGLFENIPFEDNYFDAVLSKYAIMTSANMEPVFKEIHRVLKPGGMMMYLVTHPFRQFFEKKEGKTDYFEQKIVDSHILGNTITVKEPTHTMTEFLNDFLFKILMFRLMMNDGILPLNRLGIKIPRLLYLKSKEKVNLATNFLQHYE